MNNTVLLQKYKSAAALFFIEKTVENEESLHKSNILLSHPIQNNVKLPSQSAVKKKKREVLGYSKPEQIALKRASCSRKLEKGVVWMNSKMCI